MLTRLSLFARRNAIALIALFVALGGTSVAAVNALPKNSVGSKQIEAHSVTGGDIKLSSLTGKNVKNGSLGTTDLTPLQAMYASAPTMGLADGADEVHKSFVANKRAKSYKPVEQGWPSAHIPTRKAELRERFAEFLDHEASNF